MLRSLLTFLLDEGCSLGFCGALIPSCCLFLLGSFYRRLFCYCLSSLGPLLVFFADFFLKVAQQVLRNGVSANRVRDACTRRRDFIETIVKGFIEVIPRVWNVITKVINKIVIDKRLLIRLLKLLSDVLPVHKAVLVALARIVQVRVKVKELTPGQVEVVDVLVDLLSHVDEVLSCHRVVDHRDTACLLVALSSEEGGLLTQVVHLLCGIWQHVREGSLSVV